MCKADTPKWVRDTLPGNEGTDQLAKKRVTHAKGGESFAWVPPVPGQVQEAVHVTLAPNPALGQPGV